MAQLEMFPPHVLLVFVVAFINNMALTSPQKTAKGPPNLRSIPQTSFTCLGRSTGYYADPEAECQAYHMCDTLEQQYSYLCPSYTLFNQKFMVCDHWHAVNCSIATEYYALNEKIGQVSEEKSTDSGTTHEKRKTPNHSRKLSSVFKINAIKNLSRSRPSTTTTTTSTTTTRPLRKTTRRPRTRKPFTTKASTLPTTIRPAIPSSRVFASDREPASLSNSVRGGMKHLPISARGSDLKIKFGSSNDDDPEIDKIKFRPLFKKSRRMFFDKRNFTISPDVLASTPASLFVDDDDDNHNDNDETPQTRSLSFESLSPFLIPPLIESPTDPKLKVPSPTPFLVPPQRAPVIIHADNQEIRTPLIVSRIRPFSSRHLNLLRPQVLISPPRFPFSRSNKDFFIPTPGILPPLPDNSISDENLQLNNENDNIVSHKMTMTFPNSTTLLRRRPLRINPKCPRCHPAFLRPNECQPCVIIK